MSIRPGTYKLGPGHGTLSVKTKRTGAAAKAGHDLVIHVTSWEATLEVAEDPAQSSLSLDADATSLRVIEGTGGMQALGDEDKQNIEQTINDEVLKRGRIEFHATSVQRAGADENLRVEGDLALGGTTHPIAFELAIGAGGKLSAKAVVTQSLWGMTPYTALFGTLKVSDDVVVELKAKLPAG